MQPNDPQAPFTPRDGAPQQPQYASMPEQQTPAVDDAAIEQTSDQSTDAPTQLPEQDPISWRAIEYVQHDNSPIWYVGFLFAVVVLMAGAIFFQAWTFAALILVMAVALMVYSHRPPRQLSYVWSSKGLFINDQLHPLGEFKSFGVIQDSHPDQNQLVLIPVKRFRPGLAVYFPNEVGEELVDAVGAYLPMQDLHLDTFDKIIRKLRL